LHSNRLARLACVVVVAGCAFGFSTAAASAAVTISGAGSTLIAPLEAEWAAAWDSATGNTVTYNAVGSGTGFKDIAAGLVDFGASDAPLSAYPPTCNSCVQIPWGLTATGVSYHLNGLRLPRGKALHLTGSILSKIYLGQITNWNDSRIARVNRGVHLPNLKITPIFRSDGSGDTYAFTNYLSKVSPTFKSKIGNATTVAWPGGIGGKGNSGVGGALTSTNGSIAYIAIAYVVENKFHYALVQNAAGKYPTPGVSSILAAASALKTVPSGGKQGISITDPPASAASAYPISTFTYVLVPVHSASSVGAALKKFITWAVTSGQTYGPKLDFAPLPPTVVSVAKADANLIK